jgi:putative endopeptidase
MDEPAIEKAGTKPVAAALAQIAKIKDTKTLSAAVAALEPIGFDPLFDFGPTEDIADVTKMIAGIDQHGITLPDRDYYLKDDDTSKAMRAAYLEYAQALLVEAGHKADAAKNEAAQLLALETELAKVSKDKVAMRDPKGTYNKIDRAGVTKAMPHFDWDGFFKAVGVPDLKDITVSAPDYLAGLDKQLVATPPAVWRNYLVVAVLGRGSSLLTKKLEDIHFKLSQKLEGAAEQKPRWKRCIAQTDTGLSESLGQIFVRDRFPGASKSAAEEEVRALLAAMSDNLSGLDWMDSATKLKAREKVAAMTYQIGYPAKWRTYSFKISPTTFAANVMAARRAESARQLGKIGKPVDPDEWVMTVPRVNAYNNPVHNQIVFPAGILQTPFYQVDHGVAVNLGAIGMVIGHEITHGFDDQGAQFDAKGNLSNWWQPETEKRFKERTQCVIDQYSQYEAGGSKVNGALTVGENIADIGGIKLALAAYRSLRASSPDTLVAEGFTEDQQFFLSFGQVWCEKLRPEYESLLVQTNPHSPARWRVNGALTDSPEFAKAFSCKIGAKLRPAHVCTVW